MENREEKKDIITKYLDEGYYISVEVKGATPGNQHWVAVINEENGVINIADPASDSTELWSAYESDLTSQFIYFKT